MQWEKMLQLMQPKVFRFGNKFIVLVGANYTKNKVTNVYIKLYAPYLFLLLKFEST